MSVDSLISGLVARPVLLLVVLGGAFAGASVQTTRSTATFVVDVSGCRI